MIRNVEVEIVYGEPYVPPRKRKPRTKVIKEVITFKIPVVTLKNAPVAFRYANSSDEINELFQYGEKLYSAASQTIVDDIERRTFDKWSERWTRGYAPEELAYDDRYGRDAAIKDIQWIAECIFHEDVLCCIADEPGYSVSSNLGFGNWWSCAISTLEPRYNALELEALKEKAESVKNKHPDSYVTVDEIEVLIPQAVKRPFSYDTDMKNLDKEVSKILSSLNDVRYDVCGANSFGRFKPKNPQCDHRPCKFGTSPEKCILEELTNSDQVSFLAKLAKML